MRKELHFFTFLVIGTSASFWAIFSNYFFIPVIWLLFLLTLICYLNYENVIRLLIRFFKFGVVLAFFSLLHLLFRREGTILITFLDFPLIFSNGVQEALLLWLRFLNLFVLASLFARMSPFKFILFCSKINIPLNLNLLLLTTLRIMPFIVGEVKNGLWFLRFRGIHLESLPFREKMKAGRQLLYSLIIKSLQYGSWSALALEMRGYGGISRGKINLKYQLQLIDYLILGLVIIINLITGLILNHY